MENKEEMTPEKKEEIADLENQRSRLIRKVIILCIVGLFVVGAAFGACIYFAINK